MLVDKVLARHRRRFDWIRRKCFCQPGKLGSATGGFDGWMIGRRRRGLLGEAKRRQD
jgi:hypothetical protein